MTLLFIRIFFFILSGSVGYFIGSFLLEPVSGALIGCLCGLVLIFLEQRMHRVSVRGLSSMVFGLLLGVFMANLLSDILSLLPLGDFMQSVTRVTLTLIFSYLGAVMALRGKDEFNVIIPYVRFQRRNIDERMTLLDTSAIIDGRIADIYKTNFLSGRLLVPRFVLEELRVIADSSDDIKRERGRRGIDILRLMQDDPKVDIHIHEDELIEKQDVDAKLVKLAKILESRICTVDFNLARIASLQGVEVLNMHELVHAIKSVVFSGETIRVKLVKEGKEKGQAVAYMDDGTMIVVSDARDSIGENTQVIVTSVLQTQSGKMIFARLA